MSSAAPVTDDALAPSAADAPRREPGTEPAAPTEASGRVRRATARVRNLRTRITLTFALGALALSAVLAGTTYLVTRQSLARQREETLIRQVYINARVVRDGLRSADPRVPQLLASLQTPVGSFPLVRVGNQWFPLTLEYGEAALPAELRERVATGVAARQRYDLDGATVLAVGVPLPEVDGAYFEIVSLDDLEDSLRSIGVALLAAAALATGLGVAVGLWASARAVRPLARAALAAQAIAGGALDTRIEPTEDRDLQLLSSSFNEMVTALQARIERDARFASDVSHELRSPLTTLSAAVEVLQSRRHELPERAGTALDLVVGEVARFRNLVEDLLEISRFDAGAVRLDLDEVRVGELVPNAITAVSSTMPVPIRVDPSAGGEIIRVDKRRMARVLANLLDNARVYGGGATGVSIERGSDEEHGTRTVRIAVEDRGPGVPVEDRERIFERFSRGGGAGRRGFGEGVGLGLALVREHVRLHGGRIWVEDNPGEGGGARFVIELPVVEP